jgi:glycosyltransferase involved in cell wall biosynthesis
VYLAVIPAFNEGNSIGNVVQETRKYVDQVVVVDDSSKDNTQELARVSGAIILYHSKNRGVGAAMCTGIAYAQKLKPDIVVTLDADGQHNPEDIPRLISPIMKGRADWVLGSRFLQKSPANMSLIKNLGNKFFAFITSILAGVKLTDTQTGFRALNQKALLALNLKSEFTYTQEMILILNHKGYHGVEVPIHAKPRKHGNSKVTSNFIKYGFKSLLIILSTYLRQKTRR